MILDLDIGNTRTKWRATPAAGEPLTGVLETASLVAGDLSGLLALGALRRVRISSVKSATENQKITLWMQQFFNLLPEFARSSPMASGVICGYVPADSLGVDRWLAVVAAHHQFSGNLLVVDAGTALTLDLLRFDGQHLGGYILPGRSKMLDSLNMGTAGVRVDTAQIAVTLLPGLNTADCVAAAIGAAGYGVVQAALAALPHPFSLVVTGGDGGWISQLCQNLPVDIFSVPDLVLDGLALVLPESI